MIDYSFNYSGGLYTALELEKLSAENGYKADITLIDKKEKFVFLPLLYELATGAASIPEVGKLFQHLFSLHSC